jgi:hypothetical protein
MKQELGGGYVWHPGYWVPVQPDWLWVPAHYAWTPSSCLFVDRYWDRPLVSRGQMFAPVYFQQPVYSRPNFAYIPSVGIVANALLTSLFVRPSYHAHYFGNYYAANNFQSGIFTWYSFHQSRYGYDPIYAHTSVINLGRDPQWVDQVHEVYRYRRAHPDARPRRTFVEQRRIVDNVNVLNSVNKLTVNNVTNKTNTITNVNNARNLELAHPIARLASNPQTPVRFERLDEGRRREIACQGMQVRQFHEQRVGQDVEAARLRTAKAKEARPRTPQLPKLPIAATLARRVEGAPSDQRAQLAPPLTPPAPKPDHTVRPAPPGQEIRRYEPHPDRKPPEPLQPIRPGSRPPSAPSPGQSKPGQPLPGSRPAAGG